MSKWRTAPGGPPHRRGTARVHADPLRDGLPRQHARIGPQPDRLVAQPAVLQLIKQRLHGGDKLAWLDRRRDRDPSSQLGRPEVGVNDPLNVPSDPKPEPQVPLGDRSRRVAPPGVLVVLDHGCEPTTRVSVAILDIR